MMMMLEGYRMEKKSVVEGVLYYAMTSICSDVICT